MSKASGIVPMKSSPIRMARSPLCVTIIRAAPKA
jgi:hypothetical protein